MKRFLSLLAILLLFSSTLVPIVAHHTYADSTPTNLMNNPSAETLDSSGNPVDWTPDTWGTSTTTLSTSSNAHTGNEALSVVTTSRTGDGDAKWIPARVPVTAGQTYTYTDYSEASVVTQLDAAYTNASGATSYYYLATVQPSATWQANTVSLTVPANEVSVSILHILPASGSLTTDDFSLTATTPVTVPPTGNNMIGNPSMETANGSQPAGWQTDNWGTNTANFSYLTNDGHSGTASAKVQITSYSSGDAKWYFTPVAVQPNTQYTFSDYYKATIGSALVVRLDDGSGNYTYLEPSDPVAATDWTQSSATFTTLGTTKSVTVLHLIAGVGTLQTDDASLTPVQATEPTTLTISAPANAATVSGGVQISLSPNATVGIASIQLKLDGLSLGGPITTAPWQFAWNTATTTNGSHKLQAILTTTSGKTVSSPTVTVTVSNTAANQNLYTNPSFETASATNSSLPANWQPRNWGTNNATLSYLNSGHTGTHSAEAQITSWTSGSAYWSTSAALPVVGGQMYTFSDYFKSNTQSNVEATFVMANGSEQDEYLNTAFNSPNSWTKLAFQFTAPAGAVGVYIYHDIYSVGYLTTDDFSLTPFKYQGFSRPIVSITDDDGFANYYTNALPILQKYNLASTAYIISGYIDQPNYVSSSQVKGLYNAGVEIGSHSIDHPDLTTLTPSQQITELANSQATLQNLLGVPITDYAAPYGAFSQQVTTEAKKYYQTYRTVLPGYNAKNNFNATNLYVQNITNATTVADIQGWLQEAAATNTWLILVYHEVSDTPSDATYNTPPSNFDAQMAAIKNSGISVETMSQAIQEITPQL